MKTSSRTSPENSPLPLAHAATPCLSRTSKAVGAACLVMLLCGLQLAPPAVADTVSGTLIGSVYDTGGSPLAGVLVTATNLENGKSRSATTSSDGSYRILFLPPGRYALRASFTGYVEDVRNAQEIELNRPTEPAPPLRLRSLAAAPQPAPGAATPAADTAGGVAGALAASTETFGATSLLNRSDATRRGNYALFQIQNLPLPGIRSFDDFALLTSGVSPAPETVSSVPGPGIGAGVGTAGQFSVNGQRARSNNFTVDGSDNNDPDVGVRRQGFVSLVPQSIESVQEFQISTLLWDAESGRNLGSQVNVVSRSGGIAHHGTAYGFFNDSALSARDFFDLDASPSAPLYSATAGAPVLGFVGNDFATSEPILVANGAGGKNPYTRYQAGFVLGGPIGAKTQYFVSAEFQKINASVEQNFSVPTVDDRGFGATGGTGLLLYDGQEDLYTGSYATTIAGDAVLSLYPFPNNPLGPYGANTYTEVLPADARGFVGSARLDRELRLFGRDHSLAARYNFTDDDRLVPSVGGAIYSTIESSTRTQNLSFVMNSTLSPVLLNMFRASFGRTTLDFAERRNPALVASEFGRDFLLNAPLRINNTIPSLNQFGGIVPGTPLYGLSGSSTEDLTGPLGQVYIAPYSPVGVDVYTFPQARQSNTYQFADTVAYTYRYHSFRFGVDVRKVGLDSDQQRNFRPVAVFTPAAGINFGNAYNPVTRDVVNDTLLFSGADLAALGAPSNVFQTLVGSDTASSMIRLRFTEWNGFVQDDIRLRPNLTINLGLRYEFTTVPTEVDGIIERSFTSPLVAALPDLQKVLAGRTKIYDADANNFGPRVGFAWSPGLSGKTVIRGGYGLVYDAILGAVVSQSRNVLPDFVPFNIAFRNFDSTGNTFNLFTPFNAIARNGLTIVQPGTFNTLNPQLDIIALTSGGPFDKAAANLGFVLPERNLATPYAQQFGLTVEREILADFAVSAAYVGVVGRHLLRATQPNNGANAFPLVSVIRRDDGIPEPIAIGDSFNPDRMFPTLGSFTLFESSGKSNYHGLQLEFRKRYSRNYTFSTAYTWSHSIDDASDVFDLAGSYATPANVARADLERADSNFDVRHRFAGSFLWDLPWGNLADGWQRHLQSGWRVASRIVIQTGQPYTVNTTFDSNFDGLLTDRPVDRGISETGDDQHQLDVGVAPLNYTGFFLGGFYSGSGAGTIGRNTFRAPGTANVDLAVVKTVTFAETNILELRTEVFNLLNRTHFGIPARLLEAPGFGSATYTTVPARRLQFALKYTF
jgi:hypothetical protein